MWEAHKMQDMVIERFETIDSTSLHARRLIKSWGTGGGSVEMNVPRVIVAGTQTAGVGQRGRAWCSPRGGLWCTLVVPWLGPWCRGELRGGSASTLGIRIGLVCVRTIEEVLGEVRREMSGVVDMTASQARTPMLKLPNDVLVGGRKVLGVLTEVVSALHEAGGRGSTGTSVGTLPRRWYVLIGVGINANVEIGELSPGLAPNATTLRALMGHETDLDVLLDLLSRNLMAVLDTGRFDAETVEEVSARLYGRGRPLSVRTLTGEVVEGVLTGVNEDGLVVVERAGLKYAGILAT